VPGFEGVPGFPLRGEEGDTVAEKMSGAELEEMLANYYGSETFTRYLGDLVLTEGVLAMAEAVGAFWLLDLIWSYQPKLRSDEQTREMQFWTLTVGEDKSAVATCERDTDDVVIRQKIEFTDFPKTAKPIRIWVERAGDPDGKTFYVVMLPSER